MRSYYKKLDGGNYRVTAYGLSKNKGVYSVQFDTSDDSLRDDDGNLIPEEDTMPVDTTITDIFDTFNKVLDINDTRLSIPCYMFTAIYKVTLNISSALGDKATLNMFSNKYLFHSFKLTNDNTGLEPGKYEFVFTWDGYEDDAARMTNVAEFSDDGRSISAEEADVLLHENNLYVKIFDTELSAYKLIPIIVNNDNAIDANGNNIPLVLNFQLNGIEDSGLAQITIVSYPIRFNLNAEYLISGEVTPPPNNDPEDPGVIEDDNTEDPEDPEEETP